ncbi:MAG: hypothetical protein NZT92_17000 [Abditibacteriales bacterium]|nr:hypothetical protein [Abditibacteriales bacterium]MDW8367100.1 hypothetical protein [Abditibacteriales bacterium]
MARVSWFDEQSQQPKFLEYANQMESWQRALADGVVQPEEVQEQAERIMSLMRALEPKLSDELHEEVTTLLYELAVFYGMQRLVETALLEQERG